MITISPSLLACDFLNIEKELSSFDGIKNLWYHLDIMDGHFVPNLTFGHPIIKKIGKVSKHPLDAHLMVTNPKFHVETLVKQNIHNLTFHLETFSSQSEILELIQLAKKNYPSVGLSIKPKTTIDKTSLSEIIKNIDLLLVMSVEPGFGGQSFIEETYSRLIEIEKLKRNINPKLIIQVDGGVTDTNANKLIDHGVTNLVAGSYIFKASPQDYPKLVEKLRKGQ